VVVPAGVSGLWIEVYLGAQKAGAASVGIMEPMVCGAGSLQQAFPNFTPGPSNELAADVTAIVVPTSSKLEVQTDTAGVVKEGQLPAELSFRLMRGGVAVASGLRWEYRVATGSLNGRTAASGWGEMGGTGLGVLAVNAVGPSGAAIEVRATPNGGVPRVLANPYPVTTKADVPPVGGSTGGTGSGGTSGASSSQTSSFTATGSTSNTYGNSNNQLPNVSTGPNGTLTFTAPLEYQVAGLQSGSVTMYGKWLYRLPGGTWADVAAEVVASYPSTRYSGTTTSSAKYFDTTVDEYYTEAGAIAVSQQRTNLTPNTVYEVQLCLRDNSTIRSAYVSSGTATARGS